MSEGQVLRPHNAVSDAEAAAVVNVGSAGYAGANHTHLAELPRDREGIDLSRQTVRRILARAGIIRAGPTPGNMVLDPFCGVGTFATRIVEQRVRSRGKPSLRLSRTELDDKDWEGFKSGAQEGQTGVEKVSIW